MSRNNILKIKHTISYLAKLLLFIPFLLTLSTVFIINKNLAYGVVSGKYFWFYGSMGLVGIATFIHAIINKQSFRFSVTDGFVLLFAGSVFLSPFLLGDVSANSTKLTLLALLVALYFLFKISDSRFQISDFRFQISDSRFQIPDLETETRNSKHENQGIAGLRYATPAMTDSFEVKPAMTVGIICFFIIFTGLVEAVWGLLQLYGFKPSQHGLFHLTGSFFNPGPYAGYLAVVFPMALYYFIQDFRFQISDSEHENRNMDCFVANAPRNDGTFQGIAGLRYATPAMTSFVTRHASLVTKWFAGITCIAIILVLPAAMSRASWLAAIAGSAVVLFKIQDLRFKIRNSKLGTRCTVNGKRNMDCFVANAPRNDGTRNLSRVTRHVSLIAAVVLAATLLAGMYFLKKDSADGRLLTWKMSLSALLENPFGVGLGHFPSAYGDAQAAYFASGYASETEEYVAGNPEYGFNEFLQIAIESGIVSLFLFIVMIGSAFIGLAETRNWGVMGSLIALLVFACFSYPFSVLPFPIILVFLLAMSGVNGRKNVIAGVAKRRPAIPQKVSIWFFRGQTDWFRGFRVKRGMTFLFRPIRVICVPLLCLSLTAFCIYKQYPVYDANKQWNRQKMYYQMGMYREAAQGYEPLYPYLNDRIQFLFEYGRSLSQSGMNDSQGIAGQACDDKLVESNEVLQRATKISCDPMLYNIIGQNYQAMQKYDLAEANLLKSTQIVPNRLYPWYLLMKLYIETGDERKALKAAEMVLTKEPKVQSTAVREMREEANKLKTKN